jgi:L-lactate dehydrogenase complex protein LldF
VKIDIPSVLVHLRGRVVREQRSRIDPETAAMRVLAAVFASRRRYERAQDLARLGRGPAAKLRGGPLSAWTDTRDLPEIPAQSFRDWWRSRT